MTNLYQEFNRRLKSLHIVRGQVTEVTTPLGRLQLGGKGDDGPWAQVWPGVLQGGN